MIKCILYFGKPINLSINNEQLEIKLHEIQRTESKSQRSSVK